MDYYDLPSNKRWLQDSLDHPGEIGGRDTDVSEIAYCLARRVLDSFPGGRVPEVVEVKLRRLTDTLEQAEKEIQELIGLVSWYIAGGN